jgi:hypothetical protein
MSVAGSSSRFRLDLMPRRTIIGDDDGTDPNRSFAALRDSMAGSRIAVDTCRDSEDSR